jgi:hypothetical protein
MSDIHLAVGGGVSGQRSRRRHIAQRNTARRIPGPQQRARRPHPGTGGPLSGRGAVIGLWRQAVGTGHWRPAKRRVKKIEATELTYTSIHKLWTAPWRAKISQVLTEPYPIRQSTIRKKTIFNFTGFVPFSREYGTHQCKRSKLIYDKKSPKFSLKNKKEQLLFKQTHPYDANKNSLILSESRKKCKKICGLEKQQKKWH